MKQAVEEFIKSLRGKVSAEDEKVLDLITLLVDVEGNNQKSKQEREDKELKLDSLLADFKLVEVFSTKISAPSTVAYAAVDSDGSVWLYDSVPFLVEYDAKEFAFFGNPAFRIGEITNKDVLATKQPCELCVELKELDE